MRKNIATSFWGQAWVRHIASYEVYAHRLAPGRTCLRKGAVHDLQIQPQLVTAKVQEEEAYSVRIRFAKIEDESWDAFRTQHCGEIPSLVDLLQGKIPEALIQKMIDPHTGFFPNSRDIRFSCTCLDYADLCKHAAASLYGIGLKFDEDPALFFLLRGVDPNDLLTSVGKDLLAASTDGTAHNASLGDLFGIDLEL